MKIVYEKKPSGEACNLRFAQDYYQLKQGELELQMADQLPDINTLHSAEFLNLSLFADLRKERDRLLTESDWTQLADCPLDQPTKDLWVTYRQELRDLPANTQDPSNPVWPSVP